MNQFKIVSIIAVLLGHSALFGMKAGDVLDKGDTKRSAEAAAITSGVETKARASDTHMSHSILRKVLELAGVSSPWQLADAFQKGGGIRRRVLFSQDDGTIHAVAVLPGGNIAVTDGENINEIDTATQKVVATLSNAGVNIRLMKPWSASKLVFIDARGIKIGDFATKKVEIIYPGFIQFIDVLPDGNLIFLLDNQLHILNLHTKEITKSFKGKERIRKILVLRDGSILMQHYNNIMRWDPKTDKEGLLYKADVHIQMIVKLSDNQIAFILYEKSPIYVQNLKDKSVKEYSIKQLAITNFLAPLTFTSIAFSGVRGVGKLNCITGEISFIKGSTASSDLAHMILPISESVVATNDRNNINLWDFDAGKLLATLEGKNHLQSIALLLNGVILAWSRQEVVVWEIDEKHLELLYKSMVEAAFPQPVKTEA